MTSQRMRLLGGLVLGIGTIVAAVLQASPMSAHAATSYPYGWIDSPEEGATVSGGITVTGWAIDAGSTSGTGVDKVQIFVNGAYRGDAVYGRSRPDIGAGFQSERFTPSGFMFMFDASALGGGTHQIEARSRSTVSGATTTYQRSIKVDGPAATPVVSATPTPAPTKVPVAQKTYAKSFGTNAHLTWYDSSRAMLDVERARAAGLKSVRFDVVWHKLEPSAKGGWSTSYLAQLDNAVNLVTSRGMRPLLVLVGTPAWARGNSGSQFTPPTRVEDYADVLAFLAGRYANKAGMAYEVWNEPNQREFWDAPAGPDALTYARMLKAAYTRIKAAAPSATVVGGAVAFNDQTYLQGLYAFGGIADHYDALSLHPYTQGQAPDAADSGYHSFKSAVEQTAKLMAEHGDADKAIWLTELGWGTDQISEGTRAAYMRRAVEMARGWPQVEQVMVFEQNQTDGFPALGLITSQGNATASWIAFTQAAASVPNAANSYVGGSIDSPTEWQTVTGRMRVSGWAIDQGASSGTGIDRVQVYLDGVLKGDATYGVQRADIGSAYGARFAASGFTYDLDLSGAASGAHTIEVRPRSTVTGATTSLVRGIKVSPSYPAGYIDTPAENSALTGTVRVAGWAIDQGATSGTGVDRVTIYVDGVYKGTATYGVVRADIAAGFGSSRFTNSGFSYDLNLAGLLPGTHVIEARARSTVGGVENVYRRTIVKL